MIDPWTLVAFLPAALALNLTPGADMMFCLGQGLRAGARAGWTASAGVALGVVAHACIAGLGLAAVLQALPWMFDTIRIAGVAYLLWLALDLLRHAGRPVPIRSGGHALRDGFLVNLLNPKVALFVLAFLPQFIQPDAGWVVFQFLSLGAVLAAGGFVINGLVGQSAGGARRWLAGGSRVLDYTVAAIFVGLAARLAVMERL